MTAFPANFLTTFLVLLMLVAPARPQESEGQETDSPPVENVREDARENAQEDAPQDAQSGTEPETPQSDEAGADPSGPRGEDRPSGYYLGQQPPGQNREMPARPAYAEPRTLLPGPFVPEGSILLPEPEDAEAGSLAFPQDGQPRTGDPGGGPSAMDDGDANETKLLTEPLAPSPGSAALGPASETDEAVTAMDDNVFTGALESLDPAGVGLSDIDGGALPVDFWNGTPRRAIADILSSVPLPAASARQTRLAKQLLLSPANLSAPEDGAPVASRTEGITGEQSMPTLSGPAEPAEEADQDRNAITSAILVTRLAALHSGGQSQALLALYNNIPQAMKTPAMRRLAGDGHLAMGRIADLCRLADDAVADDDDSYWLRVRALCKAVDGDRSSAYFQIDLLEESQPVGTSFMDLIERILAQENTPTILPMGDVEQLDPVIFAAAQLTRVSFPADLATDVPPILMQPIAMSPHLPPAIRLEAAREAARLALIDGTVLQNLFLGLTFSDDEIATAMSLAESDPSFRTDALLYRMAASESDPIAQARWIMAAFERSRSNGTVRIMAEALSGPTASISPAPDLAFFADTAGRIHLLAGDNAAAGNWYELVRGLASGANADATKALVDLWPLMIILDGQGRMPYSERILDLWWQGRAILPPAERKQRASLFYGLLEAFGHAVDARKWQAVLTAPAFAGPSPSLSQWRQLILAGRAGRLGETAALALAAIGRGGPGAANPSALSAAIHHLERIGLGATARRLALEALISRGF